MSILCSFLSVPVLAESYVAHDIGESIRGHLGHVLPRTPTCGIDWAPFNEESAKVTNIVEDQLLQPLHGLRGQRLNSDASFEGVHLLVNRGHRGWYFEEMSESTVNLRFLSVRVDAIDALKSCCFVDRYSVWTKANHRA